MHGLPASRRDAGQSFQVAQSFTPAFEQGGFGFATPFCFSGCLNAGAL
ncbi:hypothetical protein [Kingella oralis]